LNGNYLVARNAHAALCAFSPLLLRRWLTKPPGTCLDSYLFRTTRMSLGSTRNTAAEGQSPRPEPWT